MKRRAASLLELIIVLAILAVMIGLLLPAVQNVRLVSHKMAATNRLKHIGLATQSAIADSQGFIPCLNRIERFDRTPVFDYLRKYLEQDNLYLRSGKDSNGPVALTSVWLYLNPSDPSYRFSESPTSDSGSTSFVVNGQVFRKPMGTNQVTDGTTNTIAFAERYSYCLKTASRWEYSDTACFRADSNGNSVRVICDSTFSSRAASFADSMKYADDIVPIPNPNYPSESIGSIPDATFQVNPNFLNNCDVRQAQTPFPSGMLVGLLDGSVRNVKHGISPNIYWAAVTPNRGEVVGDW